MVAQIVFPDVLLCEGAHSRRAQLSAISAERSKQERHQRHQNHGNTAELDPSLLAHHVALYRLE